MPALTTTDEKPIAEAVAAWRAAAAAHTARADAVALCLADHEPVAAAEKTASAAELKVAKLDERLDTEELRLRQLEEDAGAAAITLIGKVAEWTGANRQLAQPTAAAPHDGEDHAADGEGWDTADIEALRDAEPGQVLDATDGFAGIASARANTWAGRLRAGARADDQRADGLRREAAKRRAEAADLRAGKLLPFPRPEWAGGGEDDDALGSAIDWQPSFDDAARPALEAALSAAGLLGATLTSSGAATSAWQVGPYGRPVPLGLAAVLAVDPDHLLAATAAAVLQRIALADSAASSADGTALVIGRDGTFRAGVAAGAPALASATGSWPPALSARGNVAPPRLPVPSSSMMKPVNWSRRPNRLPVAPKHRGRRQPRFCAPPAPSRRGRPCAQLRRVAPRKLSTWQNFHAS